MANSSKLGVPLLAADQSQKHVTHNDALNRLDQLVQQTVINRTTTAPPASPSEGHAYVIASPATGDWVGRENQIAAWITGTWFYFTPRAGWVIWDEATELHVVFDGSVWALLFSTSGVIMEWVDYSDSATAITPIQLTTPGTYYDLTNDGLGPFTNTNYATSDTLGVWDTTNQRFDFRNLKLGDTIDIRVDITPTTGGANDTIDVRMDLGIDSGGGSTPYSLPFGHMSYRYSGAHPSRALMLSVYMGDANTRDNFAKISVSADGAGASVINNGWWYRRIQR